MSGRRSLARSVGNPLTMFQEPRAKGERGDVKWSGYRFNLWLLVLAFVWNFPAEWNPWSFAAVAVLATALAIRDLMRMIPMAEMFAAITAWFGGVVGKRVTKSTTVEETTEPATPGAPTKPATPDQGEGDP